MKKQPTERQISVCERKKGYTEQEASKKAKEIGINHYKCPVCGMHHLTKMTKHQHKYVTDSSYRTDVKRKHFVERE